MRPNQITPKHVADAMGIPVGELWKLARNVEKCYKPRRKQAVGRKHRDIDPMHGAPKRLFRRLHRWFLRQKLSHPSAHGGVGGRSCFTSAECHLGRKFVWARDARDCYPSVNPKALRAELKALGFRHFTSVLLAALFSVRGQIPQGSPLSCDALNIFFWRVDQTLASFCGSKRLSYSRVADDFEIAGNDRKAGEGASRLVEKLLRDRGISINTKKLAEDGFQDQSQEQKVHNIVVNNRRGSKINAKQRKKAMDLADAFLAGCKSLQPSSLQPLAHKRRTLQGWMHYCRQAHTSPAKYLRRQLEDGDRVIKRKLRSLGVSAFKGKWWLITKNRNEPSRITASWQKKLVANGNKG